MSEDNIIHAMLGLVGVGWLVVQLFTNGKIAEVVNVITKQNGLLEAHIASDDQKHKALDYQGEQHDRRLDRLEDKIINRS